MGAAGLAPQGARWQEPVIELQNMEKSQYAFQIYIRFPVIIPTGICALHHNHHQTKMTARLTAEDFDTVEAAANPNGRAGPLRPDFRGTIYDLFADLNEEGLVIGLDGNIGVGKSTFGEWLHEQSKRCDFYRECINEPLLGKFIEDRKRWAGRFQIYAFNDCQGRTTAARRVRDRDGAVSIIDRTLWGNNVFASVNVGDFQPDDVEWYATVRTVQPLLQLSVLVYFDLSAEQCMERIGLRGTEAEQGYMPDYLRQLDNWYFHALLEAAERRDCPVCVAPPAPMSAYPALVHRIKEYATGAQRSPTVRLVRRNRSDSPIPIPNPAQTTGGDGRCLVTSPRTLHDRFLMGPPPAGGALGATEDYYDYALFADHPEHFKRAVMASLGADRHVTVVNWQSPRDPFKPV